MKVLCVATDDASLVALRRAAVAAEWELVGGAKNAAEARIQLEEERPHFLLVFGPFAELVAEARERYPTLRIVSDRDLPGADVVATSLAEVRGALVGAPRPGGPVR
ncbi:MAG: hypothetical protein WEA10_09720 [Actinomycetota bacterium]